MIYYPTVCRGTEMDIYIWTAAFIANKVQARDNGLETDQQHLIQTNFTQEKLALNDYS
jgi:hypothetical protein